MTEEEKKKIQIINNFIMYCRGFEEKKYTDRELFTVIEDIGELIQKLKQENEKKDKIIDAIAEELSNFNNLGMCDNCEKKLEDNYDFNKCKECVKQYFERKVKDEDNKLVNNRQKWNKRN